MNDNDDKGRSGADGLGRGIGKEELAFLCAAARHASQDHPLEKLQAIDKLRYLTTKKQRCGHLRQRASEANLT
ncbi:MAG: hypothetical protein LBJ15_16455 [Comamonas sp.]|jgi:hypothetical protein|uniref:hypothetical protein n=1 Tax=Comamonas sp. TaxID=34028 RepID=UPI0028314CE9|nr:hypothetical protein [Comamonas sp.]MDR0215575.1 hypothetical protein [Comamonas sp.]